MTVAEVGYTLFNYSIVRLDQVNEIAAVQLQFKPSTGMYAELDHMIWSTVVEVDYKETDSLKEVLVAAMQIAEKELDLLRGILTDSWISEVSKRSDIGEEKMTIMKNTPIEETVMEPSLYDRPVKAMKTNGRVPVLS